MLRDIFEAHEVVKAADVVLMEHTAFGVGVYDLDEDISQVRGVDHEQNHHEYGVKLHRYNLTASHGFLANGPGAKVERVPVENCWP